MLSAKEDHRMLDILKKADKGIMWLQTAFCVIMMFALMWLVFAMVFWRYVLNNSIVWAEEVLRYMMMWVVLVGAGLATREDQHVSIDVLQTILAKWPKARAIHYLITRLIVAAFLIYLIGPSMDLIHRTANSTATSLVWLPKSVIYASFVAGIFSILLSLCSQVPRKVYDIIHGIEDDESLLEMQALAEKTELELKKAAEAELAGEAEEIPPLAASPVPAEPIEEITETISEDEAGGEKQ
jgi:TRAP-type C4-dicarboxylate transport system permease small subunit